MAQGERGSAPEVGQAFALFFRHVVAVLLICRRHRGEPASGAHRMPFDCSDRVADLVMVADRMLSLVLRIRFAAGAFAHAQQSGIEDLLLRFGVNLKEGRKSPPDGAERARIARVYLLQGGKLPPLLVVIVQNQLSDVHFHAFAMGVPRRLNAQEVSFETVRSNHPTLRLARPACEHDWREARRLIEEYAASLNVDLCFQNFAHEIEHLADEYGPPAGAFLLAVERGVNLGCVGLRRMLGGVAEMKRLYAAPAARGRGVGRLLAEGIIDAARALGYTAVVLDTLPWMKEAQSLYAALGFKGTSAYRFNPVPGTAYLELKLR